MVSNSMYGEDGTRTTAGTGTFSGTYEKTLAATDPSAVASGVRTAERIVEAGITGRSFRHRRVNRGDLRSDCKVSDPCGMAMG